MCLGEMVAEDLLGRPMRSLIISGCELGHHVPCARRPAEKALWQPDTEEEEIDSLPLFDGAGEAPEC
jgi:hypothetical protein